MPQLWTRLPIKKRLVFPGKTMKKMKANKKKKKMKKVIKVEDEGAVDETADRATTSKQSDFPDDLEFEKTTRKSTRTAVVVRQAEREAIRAEKQATARVCIHSPTLNLLHCVV
jgi:vacuolar protein sorting-associated protein 72